MQDLTDTTITSVVATPLRFPLQRPISSALGSYAHVDAAAVEVRTKDGPTGFGFCAGLGGHAAHAIATYLHEELVPLLLGRDGLAVEAVADELWSANKARMRGGLAAWALSAVDIALWDILAKAAGLSLNTVLGGFRREVPVYGSGGWHSLSDEEMVEEAIGFLGQGISAYKYKVGTDRDRQRTALLRAELGDDVILLADANQRFTVDEAIDVSAMLADFGVAWLEEPVLADSTSDLAAVAARASLPLAAGENIYYAWGFREIVDQRAATFLQPDVGRVGGVTHFMRVCHLADAFALKLSSHLWHELSSSLVGAARSGYMVEYAPLLPADATNGDFGVVDGHIRVPDTPGHGFGLTDEALRKYAIWGERQ